MNSSKQEILIPIAILNCKSTTTTNAVWEDYLYKFCLRLSFDLNGLLTCSGHYSLQAMAFLQIVIFIAGKLLAI